MMGSGVKWVFCALFCTMSTAKKIFEYRIPPLYDAWWRCPLYHSTILRSWLQDLPVSMFELPNKTPSFRLRHSANAKLLNVSVSHSLDEQWFEEFVLQITVSNDRRIFDGKTKINFNSSTGSAKTPGSQRESRSHLLEEIFFGKIHRHGNESKRILGWDMDCDHIMTPAKYVLLVNINLLPGLKFHPGL